MRRLALSVIALGLAVGGGYLLGSTRAQEPAPALVARTPDAHPAVAVVERGLSEADLRRVVQQELAAREPAPERAKEPAPAPAAPAGNPAAFDDGMRRVNQAIARRQWTREDAMAMARTLDTLSPEQRATLLRTLVPALNRGEVKLTFRGELF